MKVLMTGNEAIARGAYEAGVHFAAAYPGTPSTEILENIAPHKEIIAEWAPNEKVAVESAVGACYAGARSITAMKHVGLNVAADPFFTIGYTGVNGGMVLVSADDPGLHSSQNEQDNRYYAKSRMVENEEEVVSKIVDAANELAGEKFNLDTPVTGLSGGQSRALMIADTAILSTSPIVLIDEIENAGIDRKRALNLLVNEEKIVLMATHDPSLALMADKRIVIRNGGIYKVIETGPKEKEALKELEKMDKIISNLRTRLRSGDTIDTDLALI
jgi:ABC-type dipeptide/oligopeptide/nickel transport system ATPase component